MGRTKGLLPLSANFEVATAEPLDARNRVALKSDLTSDTIDNPFGSLAYKGMLVYVYGDGANNGLYVLTQTPHTDINNWSVAGGANLEEINTLYQPDGTNPFVYTDNAGVLHIDGDIVQNGDTYETHVEKLYTTKDLIITREEATTAIATGDISGLEVTLYDGVNNLIFGTDSNGYFKVGELGSLQTLVTRPDNPTDNAVALWDGVNDSLKFIARSNIDVGDFSNNVGYLTDSDVSTGTIKRVHLKKTTSETFAEGMANAFSIGWDIEEYIDTDVYGRSNPDYGVTVKSSGVYKIFASIVHENGTSSARNVPFTYVLKNGVRIDSTVTADYDRGASYGRFSNNNVYTVLALSAGDVIEIGTYAYLENGTLSIRENFCEFIIEKVGSEAVSNTWRPFDDVSVDLHINKTNSQIHLGGGTHTGPHGINFYDMNNLGIGISQFYRTSPKTLYWELSNGADLMSLDKGGNLTASGNFQASGYVRSSASDKRLKENIVPIDNALGKISKLKGITFNWNDTAKSLNDSFTNDLEVGLIAQEVQKIQPEAVGFAPFDRGGNKSKSGKDYLTVNEEKLVPLLVQAINELRVEINKLKQR